jgi:hypothetical protein
MELQNGTTQFIEDLQKHYGRTLSFPLEVGFLIDQTNLQGLNQPFLDAIFHAKFAIKSREVISRIGRDSEGFDKLSSEFQTSVEKASTLLKTIVKESDDAGKQHFVREFFSLDQASFSRLMLLFEDLSWVKNWDVDGRPLPVVGANPRSSHQLQVPLSGDHDGTLRSIEELVRIRKGSSFALLLVVVFCVVDTPATILGWGLIIVIASLLLYTFTVSHKLVRTSR